MNDERLQQAVKGQYDWHIGDLFKEAWHKVKGSKGSYWAALILFFLIYILIMMVVVGIPTGIIRHVYEIAPRVHPTGVAGIVLGTVNVVTLLVALAIVLPMAAGIVFMSVQKAADHPISYKMLFKFFFKWKYMWRFLLVTVLLFIAIGIPYGGGLALVATQNIFGVLAGVVLLVAFAYLLPCYYLVLPLMVDRNLAPWAAMEASRRAITKHWLKVVVLWALIMLVMLASMLTLGIALIWTLPLAKNLLGVQYRETFGIVG